VGWLVIFLMLLITRQCQASDIFVRAILPNPPGSDTQEWILLERQPGASFSAEIVVKDGLGAVQSYDFCPFFTTGDQLRLMKSETGISLNNDADWVEIWQEGDLVDRTETFENSTEGSVWTRLGNVWQSLTSEEFALRLASMDWNDSVEIDDSETNTASDSAETTTDSTQATPTSKSSPKLSPLPTATPAQKFANSSPQPSISPILYQQWLAMPQFLVSPQPKAATESSSFTPRSPPAYPQLDGEGERKRFYDWQKKAILGAFGFLLAGVCFVVLATPALCRWYNDKQCIW